MIYKGRWLVKCNTALPLRENLDTSDGSPILIAHNKESERSPFFGFMFDASGVTTEMSAIANVYNQYVPGLICGTVDPETTMPEFLNALDAAGINTVIQAKQEQLDAWIAAQK